VSGCFFSEHSVYALCDMQCPVTFTYLSRTAQNVLLVVHARNDDAVLYVLAC